MALADENSAVGVEEAAIAIVSTIPIRSVAILLHLCLYIFSLARIDPLPTNS